MAGEVEMAGFKAAAPSLDGTIERSAALAALRRPHAPARWLTGVSGSGKSTLVAAHVRATGRRHVWYRLDARDDDAAFFYANFTAAVGYALPAARVLPSFTDDDRGREHAFAGRFFTALVRHAGDVIVVFDNAHRITGEAMQRALAAFVAHANAPLEIWFASEEPPPRAFFDVMAQRKLGLCNDVPLAFDAQECDALAAASRSPALDGGELAVLTGGHAATLVLACELLRGAQATAPAHAQRTVSEIHRHLLGSLLDRMPDGRRALLLRTSFAPQLTEGIVRALAGERALGELDVLCAQGLLRRTEAQGTVMYEAHGLVRNGLRSVAVERLGEVAVADLAARTAEALESEGFDEEAFALLAGRGAFDRAARVLERITERYARRGQAELAARALAALPATACDERPWLCFWAGQVLLGASEEAARAWFERAYTAFERMGDAIGKRVAAGRVVMAYGLEYGDLRNLDTWMERHTHSGGDSAVSPGTPYESVMLLGVVNDALMRGAHPPGIDADTLVRRLRVLIEDDAAWLTPHERVVAARLLIDHARIFGAPERAQAFVLETQAIAQRPELSALQRGRWYIAAASVFAYDGKPERAAEHLAAARELAESSGSQRLAFELGMAQVDALLKRSDLQGATGELAALEALAVSAPPAQRAEYARITARTLLFQDRLPEGLRWAEQALETARLAGYSPAHARQYAMEYTYALAANERFDDAVAVAVEAASHQDERQAEATLIVRDALRVLASNGDDLALLESTLARAERMAFVNLLSRARAPLARLCQVALAHGLHADFVRRVIALHRLEAPASAGPEWPWPVKIRALGGFELTIAGERYQPPHKTQDKPLELLKLLVTCEVLGRASADREWVAERLWPGAGEANARKSLEMTLSRLRKLLRDDDAIMLSEGRLRVSPSRVWTDIRPLLHALRQVRSHRDRQARGALPAVASAVADIGAVLDHYHGQFLPEEGDAPWLIAGREAVAGAVRSALLIADAVLEGREDDRLIPALERALAADPTSEDLARALMRAWSRRGEYAEAVRVYRRLRDMLSVILGLPPSRETEQMKDDLYARVSAGDTGAGAARVAPGRMSP
jgi:DNA-binding SARP family transcriptional activator